MARLSTEGRTTDGGQVEHGPTKRLALIRSEFGPWIPTVNVRRPYLKITGLKDAVVTVFQRTALGECVQELVKNGSHELVPALWTRVSCVPKCKTVICVVTSGPAD